MREIFDNLAKPVEAVEVRDFNYGAHLLCKGVGRVIGDELSAAVAPEGHLPGRNLVALHAAKVLQLVSIPREVPKGQKKLGFSAMKSTIIVSCGAGCW